MESFNRIRNGRRFRARNEGWFRILFLILLIQTPATVLGDDPPPAVPEYRLKAALLYKFTKFIQWPESAFSGPDAHFTLCVLGEDPFGATLDGVAGRHVHKRTITVVRSKHLEDIDHSCQVIFVSASEQMRWISIRDKLRQQPALTISDIPDFVRQGGMIQLMERKGKIGFEIGLEAATQAGIRIGARLIDVAAKIR